MSIPKALFTVTIGNTWSPCCVPMVMMRMEEMGCALTCGQQEGSIKVVWTHHLVPTDKR